MRAAFGGALEQLAQVEPDDAEHPGRHHGRADEQQHRLDDLHVGGALHAAHQHVEDHQGADDDDHEALADPVARRDLQQQRDQPARPRHLREQVERRDDERRGRRGRAHRALAHPVGQHVAHRVAARVPQQLRDQQQRHQPGHEETDRVEEPVVAVDGDRPRDPEERRRRQVVARDRHAVLRAGEPAARRVVVRRRAGRAPRAVHQHEGDQHERPEDREVQPDAADLLLGGHRRPARRGGISSPVRICAASGSSRRRAKRP